MTSSILRWLTLTSFLIAPLWNAVPAFASIHPFWDVNQNTPYVEAIETLRDEGVIAGYSDGSFKPDATINRAELLKILLEARTDGTLLERTKCFPDVQEQWYATYVCTAKAENIIDGYDDGLFRPERPVNIVEAAKIFSLAYEQDVEASGGEWYVPYMRALENSRAIPPSASKLESSLTRGEMAELMWRLSKGITDEPSKGYLNVKYPAVKTDLSQDSAQAAGSCAVLQAFAAESQTTGGWGRGGGSDEMQQSNGAVLAPTATETKSNDADYSQTNVQVQGVDEADIVKTDGTYLYIVTGNSIRIVRAVPAGSMQLLSTLFDEDSTFSPSELYVDGDRLIVLGSSWVKSGPISILQGTARTTITPYPYGTSRMQARIYDVSDRSKPTLERKVSFDGWTVSSRMIGHKLTLVINQPMRWVTAPLPSSIKTETDVLPLFSDTNDGGSFRPVETCADVIILPREPFPQYLTVGVIDVSKPTSDVQRTVVLGNASNVYASLQNLYVAAPQTVYSWRSAIGRSEEKTNLYRFAFTDNGAELKAEGSVPGRILNQFSMDEHANTFRIATTKGNSWDETVVSSNNLYVQNLSLETVGKIEDLAPGEQIYSVRFLGNRAYMVTFKNTDPLFVLDTSDPRNPMLLGKLKIPGYSDYLHPYDETHLLGFGKEAVDAKDGQFAWYQGMKIALFDVTDVANPRELYKETIGDRGTTSPLLSNHKALLFEKDRKLLSFPVTVYELTAEQKAGSDPGAYGSPVFQGAYVYDLTLNGGFKLRGTLTHYGEDTFAKVGSYWYDSGKDVQRVVRIGESLYTISAQEVTGNALSTLSEQGSVLFPETGDTSSCGPYGCSVLKIE
ncbi:MAG: beta-propeller domain-containing protein [Candidatus Peribacteraceae bacterium]|jgi:uncharacterized secreted protein with C-terminal beta-propeller domain